jgi:S-adenosylmethionine-diacylglycerol 3-amino-3-carboxypropyl transferase
MAVEYFSDLNYTLANEDTQIEYRLMPDNAKAVFSVAGSGARCLPLIAKNPDEIHVVDMSVSQLYLCELRYQAAKVLTYEEWLYFLGYRGGLQDGSLEGDTRLELFERIQLSTEAYKYWTDRKQGWEKRGFILLGRWEGHFQKLGKIFKDYLKCDFSGIFKAQNLPEQIDLYDKTWPHVRWKSFLRILASEYVFNKFLYKGHFAGKSSHKTESRPPYQLVEEEFKRVFTTQLARKSYFMQILFLGEIRYEEGLPLEAHRRIFEAIKAANTKVHYHLGNLLDVLPKTAFDFISLSDTISYIPTDRAEKILQDLHPKTPKGTRVVIRSFMRAPQDIALDGWRRLPRAESEAHKNDSTGVYQFHIFEKV